MQNYLVYRSKGRFRAMPMDNSEPITSDGIKEYWLVEAPNRKEAIGVVSQSKPDSIITLHLATLKFSTDEDTIAVDALTAQ